MPHPPDIDLLCDGHVHTRLCNHATGEMEDYVISAINKGLREIIFLEHLETGIDYHPPAWLSDNDFDFYFAEGERLRNIYGENIQIGLGAEVGYNSSFQGKILERIAARNWDRLGISCHYLLYEKETGGHLNLLSRRKENHARARQIGPNRILTDYLDTLQEAVRYLPGTVLCHLDAALRHLPEAAFGVEHHQRVDTLLDLVKEKGMALELNTSGFLYRKQPFPASSFLTMALQKEIPLVAGSDAHRPQDVGRSFELLPDYISQANRTLPCPKTGR